MSVYESDVRDDEPSRKKVFLAKNLIKLRELVGARGSSAWSRSAVVRGCIYSLLVVAFTFYQIRGSVSGWSSGHALCLFGGMLAGALAQFFLLNAYNNFMIPALLAFVDWERVEQCIDESRPSGAPRDRRSDDPYEPPAN